MYQKGEILKKINKIESLLLDLKLSLGQNTDAIFNNNTKSKKELENQKQKENRNYILSRFEKIKNRNQM